MSICLEKTTYLLVNSKKHILFRFYLPTLLKDTTV